MSLEGAFFEMAKDALGGVFSGDHAPDFTGQSAVLDDALEAAKGVIREYEVSAEQMAKLMATLAAIGGAVILSAIFVGGRWIVKVRFG